MQRLALELLDFLSNQDFIDLSEYRTQVIDCLTREGASPCFYKNMSFESVDPWIALSITKTDIHKGVEWEFTNDFKIGITRYAFIKALKTNPSRIYKKKALTGEFSLKNS